ncbi:hypothetical protein [Streptomyces sp. NPDC060243]|uniref:hypothetical protein n=1 Tax=Streptomyces sp. NPDC060243 TaxID=3347081 RepID=UPI003653AC74
MDTSKLIAAADRALDGRHPEHNWPIDNGMETAAAYALVALAHEKRKTNAQLASIGVSLNQIDRALTALVESRKAETTALAPEPRRRLWPRTRRTTKTA